MLLSNTSEREKSQKQRPYSKSRQPSLLERMSPPMRSLSVHSHPTSASSISLLERISPGEQPHPLEFQEPLNQKPLSEQLLQPPLPPPTGNRQTMMSSSFQPQATQQVLGGSIQSTQNLRRQKRGQRSATGPLSMRGFFPWRATA
jgi:hypothetical protein